VPIYEKLKTTSVFDERSIVDAIYLSNIRGNVFLSNLKNKKPSIIHDNGAWLPFHLKMFIYAKLLNIPFILSPHGMFESWAMSHKALKKTIAWHLYQKYILFLSDALVVNSEKEYSRIRSLGSKQPIAIIESGIDFSDVSCVGELKSKLLSKQALFLSRINPVKGILELIDAWSSSKALTEYKYVLNIYGNSDDHVYLDRVKNRIIELGIENYVFLKGPVYGAEKWDVYENHDFFILPSHCESFGIVIPEALFAGMPVITTTGTPWSILESKGFGKIVSLNCTELQKAIDGMVETLIKHNGLDQNFRNKTRDYVVENYSWPKITEKYIVFYEWLLSGKNLPEFVRLD
jgi:glycosyltransferase involved in cell wall biosynthesis